MPKAVHHFSPPLIWPLHWTPCQISSMNYTSPQMPCTLQEPYTKNHKHCNIPSTKHRSKILLHCQIVAFYFARKSGQDVRTSFVSTVLHEPNVLFPLSPKMPLPISTTPSRATCLPSDESYNEEESTGAYSLPCDDSFLWDMNSATHPNSQHDKTKGSKSPVPIESSEKFCVLDIEDTVPSYE